MQLQQTSARPTEHTGIHRAPSLDDEARKIVRTSDTFFIALRSSAKASAANKGTDVSHRGGRPGFVLCAENGTLSFPDFSGNLFFNTLGNIELDARVGLLFVDFDTGVALFIGGRAHIDWSEDRVSEFKGAERIIDVIPDEVVRVLELLSISSSRAEPSPYLSHTGIWSESSYQPMQIVRQQRESADAVSVYLKPKNQIQIENYQAGQFLPIKLRLQGQDSPVFRAYTLSRGPLDSLREQTYRLTIRHKSDGLVSSALNTQDLHQIQLRAVQRRCY